MSASQTKASSFSSYSPHTLHLSSSCKRSPSHSTPMSHLRSSPLNGSSYTRTPSSLPRKTTCNPLQGQRTRIADPSATSRYTSPLHCSRGIFLDLQAPSRPATTRLRQDLRPSQLREPAPHTWTVDAEKQAMTHPTSAIPTSRPGQSHTTPWPFPKRLGSHP